MSNYNDSTQVIEELRDMILSIDPLAVLPEISKYNDSTQVIEWLRILALVIGNGGGGGTGTTYNFLNGLKEGGGNVELGDLTKNAAIDGNGHRYTIDNLNRFQASARDVNGVLKTFIAATGVQAFLSAVTDNGQTQGFFARATGSNKVLTIQNSQTGLGAEYNQAFDCENQDFSNVAHNFKIPYIKNIKEYVKNGSDSLYAKDKIITPVLSVADFGKNHDNFTLTMAADTELNFQKPNKGQVQIAKVKHGGFAINFDLTTNLGIITEDSDIPTTDTDYYIEIINRSDVEDTKSVLTIKNIRYK